jgi:hypothetical protein
VAITKTRFSAFSEPLKPQRREHGAAEPQWKIPDSNSISELPEKFARKATNYDLVLRRFSVASVLGFFLAAEDTEGLLADF